MSEYPAPPACCLRAAWRGGRAAAQLPDPFFNADTMDDIAEAGRLAELDGG